MKFKAFRRNAIYEVIGYSKAIVSVNVPFLLKLAAIYQDDVSYYCLIGAICIRGCRSSHASQQKRMDLVKRE